MKRIMSFFVAVILLTVIVLPVSAEQYVQPRYTYINDVSAELSINTTTGVATCTGSVCARSMKPVKVVVSLQKDMGTYWQTLESWSGTGTMEIQIINRFGVYSDETYRVFTAAYVYASNNNLLESASATHEVYYP